MKIFESEALKAASRQAAEERQPLVDALSSLPGPAAPLPVKERAAKLCEMTADQLRLMCGEMTAGEVRTVKAVLASRAAAIRALPLVTHFTMPGLFPSSEKGITTTHERNRGMTDLEVHTGDQRLADLGNGVSDAIHKALSDGLAPDFVCSVIVNVVAEYWMQAYVDPPTALTEILQAKTAKRHGI